MWSVIICSIDDARYSAAASIFAKLLAAEPHEIIRISDARSLAEGYNRGIRQSRGEVIILSHDDVEILDEGFAAKIKSRLQTCDMLGVAGTARLCGPQWIAGGPPDLYGQVAHVAPDNQGYDLMIWSAALPLMTGAQALDGALLCMTRRVVEAVSFDEQAFDGFHLYDLDFTFRAYQHGMKLGICADVPVIHASEGQFGPAWEKYALRFMQKHAAALPPMPDADGQFCVVRVRQKADLLRYFNPPHFRDLKS